MANNAFRDDGRGIETQEVDGSHLNRALAQGGHAAGEASQEEIDQLLREEDLEKVDHTREIDVREVRKRLQES